MSESLPMRRMTTTVGFVITMNLLAVSAFGADRPPPPPPVPPPGAAPQPAPAAPAVAWGRLTQDKTHSWNLTAPEVTVGSDATCDIVLADTTVAPRHFRIAFANGNAAVVDLGSKTGTLVAGAFVKPGQSFKVMNSVEIDPGAVTLQFEFLDRGTISPSQPVKKRKESPKVKVVLPPKSK